MNSVLRVLLRRSRRGSADGSASIPETSKLIFSINSHPLLSILVDINNGVGPAGTVAVREINSIRSKNDAGAGKLLGCSSHHLAISELSHERNITWMKRDVNAYTKDLLDFVF